MMETVINMPITPVKITNTAVIVSLPPSITETFIASGVVIERGARLST